MEHFCSISTIFPWPPYLVLSIIFDQWAWFTCIENSSGFSSNVCRPNILTPNCFQWGQQPSSWTSSIPTKSPWAFSENNPLQNHIPISLSNSWMVEGVIFAALEARHNPLVLQVVNQYWSSVCQRLCVWWAMILLNTNGISRSTDDHDLSSVMLVD